MFGIKKVKNKSWIHGGDSTPQYFCKLCMVAHTVHSDIGKLHKEYMRK